MCLGLAVILRDITGFRTLQLYIGRHFDRATAMQLHPQAKRLPFAHQGPFVTTGDGGVLCFDDKHAHHSVDEGVTWESHPLFAEEAPFQPSTERALLRTRDGTIIAGWINLAEKQHAPDFRWGGPVSDYAQWILPLYVSLSHDEGRTWDQPQCLNRPWCGCVHSMIQTRSGRIVLVGQAVSPKWRHTTVMFLSDDEGKTWQRGSVLDIGAGFHDHAGSCEATVIQRTDDSLYMLLRNETGFLTESISTDDGLTWSDQKLSALPSVMCCAQMRTLSDGTVALLWNPPPRYDPAEPVSRDELAFARSRDGGKTWEPRVIVAADYSRIRELPEYIRASYPYLYERRPGELWITTMYGDVRIKIDPEKITQGSIPLPPTVVLFGDSTTARRPAEVKSVYAVHLQEKLIAAGLDHVVANRGIPGHNTGHAIARFESDVLSLKPALVVIQFGLNDAAINLNDDPPATGPRVSKKIYLANLQHMIEALKERQIPVVLMTPNRMYWSPLLRELYGKPPYDVNNPESFNELHLDSYVAGVRELAATLSVPLIDINQAYLDSDNPRQFLLERCMQHPNDEGHKLIADQLAPVVIELLKS